MNELEAKLNHFRGVLSKASKARSLYRCQHCGREKEGYDFLKAEIEAMLELFKREAVSPKSLASQVDHAVIVGAHNALRGLLDTIETLGQGADLAQAKVRELENEIKDQGENAHV